VGEIWESDEFGGYTSDGVLTPSQLENWRHCIRTQKELNSWKSLYMAVIEKSDKSISAGSMNLNKLTVSLS
jgi:hypothetical protein